MTTPTAHDSEMPSRPHLTVVQGGAATEASEAEAEQIPRQDPAERVAGALIDEFGDRMLFLFHRRVAGLAGELPVVAVTSAGVHLIEPRAYDGRKVRTCADGSSFVIDGMRHSRLADQMLDRAEALQAAVATGPIPDAAVFTSYCFVDSDLPWRRMEVAGTPVLNLRSTMKRLRRRGTLGEREIEALHRDLSLRLPRV